jgi:hypothetical protein
MAIVDSTVIALSCIVRQLVPYFSEIHRSTLASFYLLYIISNGYILTGGGGVNTCIQFFENLFV